MLQIFNTLTLKKEPFKPLKQNAPVKIYYCGPTPYNFAHIGNLKTYVVEDMVVRSLQYLGYKTATLSNITDIDDKTIRDSQISGEKLLDFTKKYTQFFLDDLKKLRVNLADNVVPISTLIPEMITIIQGILDKWYAYLWDDGSVYYEIKKFKRYGELAHLDFSGMKASVRIDNDEYDKENAADFALWKAWKEEDWENFWEAEFQIGGEKHTLKGRPGWHIECSACNMKYFGPQIDIHMWGVDLIFPHHQNEIAQSEAYTGKKFSTYWIHSGHVMIGGKKMSKSLKNFYTLRDIEEHFSDIDQDILFRAVRLSFLNARYRESVDFSFEKLKSNITTIQKLDTSTKKLLHVLGGKKDQKAFRREIREALQEIIGQYIEKIEDDFNMPEAFGVVFQAVTWVNTLLDEWKLSSGEAQSLLDLYKNFDSIVGMFSFEREEQISEEILELFTQRNEAKKAKDFVRADALRDELLQKWYTIFDERTGARIERNT